MTVYIRLLGSPTFTDAFQLLLEDSLSSEQAHWSETTAATPAERIVEFAGRVCYMSFGSKQSSKSNAEYIANLIRNGHESVLEHAVWTFAISGISRAFTHQLVRHRVGFSFSQLSQQYHDESQARFVRPEGIDNVLEAAAAWDKSVFETAQSYKKILEWLKANKQTELQTTRAETIRAIRSAARSVLPNATETIIVVTSNASVIGLLVLIMLGIVGIGAEIEYLPYVWRTYSP
jgi:thymidylate synthase (FAD)